MLQQVSGVSAQRFCQIVSVLGLGWPPAGTKASMEAEVGAQGGDLG